MSAVTVRVQQTFHSGYIMLLEWPNAKKIDMNTKHLQNLGKMLMLTKQLIFFHLSL